MSQIAEPVIAGLEVVEHFDDVREVLARLAFRDEAASLLDECARAIADASAVYHLDHGYVARVQLHASSLRIALASSGPRGLALAVRAARSSLGRFNRSLAHCCPIFVGPCAA